MGTRHRPRSTGLPPRITGLPMACRILAAVTLLSVAACVGLAFVPAGSPNPRARAPRALRLAARPTAAEFDEEAATTSAASGWLAAAALGLVLGIAASPMGSMAYDSSDQGAPPLLEQSKASAAPRPSAADLGGGDRMSREIEKTKGNGGADDSSASFIGGKEAMDPNMPRLS